MIRVTRLERFIALLFGLGLVLGVAGLLVVLRVIP